MPSITPLSYNDPFCATREKLNIPAWAYILGFLCLLAIAVSTYAVFCLSFEKTQQVARSDVFSVEGGRFPRLEAGHSGEQDSQSSSRDGQGRNEGITVTLEPIESMSVLPSSVRSDEGLTEDGLSEQQVIDPIEQKARKLLARLERLSREINNGN